MRNKVEDRERWIALVNGRPFHPFAPRHDEIDIECIAWGLAGEHRYGNQTRARYTVAEHCVRVSLICSPRAALHGLLHDASEGLGLRDIPGPIKHAPALAGYRELERKVQRVIYERFGLNPREPQEVKHADRVLLATERRDVAMASKLWDQNLPEPLPERITPWDARTAYQKYLSRFFELGGRL